ncbi:hypothetical protein [Streptomyces sp. NPDC059979]|uniref:hypothetical protein n=1 Tax=Streptomyces sp. NPDC059979 TaxID=3347021 RepID=UPI0036C31C0A|nr:hypothetical protein KPP03845_106766 [Streptomyces xanthophaeus]
MLSLCRAAGPASPLFAFAGVLTAGGATLYLLGAENPWVLAVCTFVLACAAGLWCAARHDR